MSSANHKSDELFRGLKSLSQTAFPKKCPTCGRVYENEEQYIAATEAVRPAKSGLKESFDDDDNQIVELYRNCVCGSTLMEFFGDRRDNSPNGVKRREIFGQLLDLLVEDGVDPEVARLELLKKLYGKKSDLLDKM